MPRSFDRTAAQLRPVLIHRHYTRHAEGSVLVEIGHTKVLPQLLGETRSLLADAWSSG